METTKGILYLVPCHLSEDQMATILPPSTIDIATQLTFWVAENEKTARRFLRDVGTKIPLNNLVFSELNKLTDPALVKSMLFPALEGNDLGLISEAGCPAVADPGSRLVEVAHQMGIRVVPLVGPSSILMSLMASGMNGQNFAFNGYLPIDREAKKRAILELESMAKKRKQTQIFMETPFRNDALLEECLKCLQPNTRMTISVDLTSKDEWISSGTIAQWKKREIPSLHKRLAVFCISS